MTGVTAPPALEPSYEVVVIGGGPAGLSAALNLARARRRVLVVDGNRPRHAATLLAHGFLTRDGVSPLELRRMGREEVDAYDNATVVFAQVGAVSVEGDGFRVTARGVRGGSDVDVRADTVLIATGVTETMPAIPSIRAFYGTQLHSCIECDGFESAGQPLALIGETDDLAERALLLTQWTDDLIVFTNGVAPIGEDEERTLARLGVRVERRPIDDVVGEKGVMTGVRLADGTLVERAGGFLRPVWSPSLSFVDALDLDRDADGYLLTDADGRTSLPGVYAAGETSAPGPQQLIVAAGSGAVVAAAVNRDLIGLSLEDAAVL
ncbi:Thioredoxin reductase [Leifsonia sp. 98AMF]|uniref:NAD(P)/FAD-dependent oxidoreductase n=1 Tax=unclassified Leifsonia TaxID=2663824 RepID=UPI0008797138|nr:MULTISPECIES: NAD(P)/FAD-dependent oxidoreductase [unclassified Leifsonia]SDH28932.1 Thioredoxin reductase [Leifsonia sp. 197AMF]SDJ09021.1 Thioredoxin reductase [Leifsonia sp. 466MF]SDJ61830.1 Thioredoxin reductase [Leifsonia sp. 157MF]SDN30167.1 Thioredoxin reductase [Leifsonia sp. 509MF]SEM91001.1 Thioredoxin reductase [Leifsonia sp. 467MF]